MSHPGLMLGIKKKEEGGGGNLSARCTKSYLWQSVKLQ